MKRLVIGCLAAAYESARVKLVVSGYVIDLR